MRLADLWVRRIAGFGPIFQPLSPGLSDKPVSWTPRVSSSAAPGRSRPVACWENRPADEVRVYVPVTANGEEPPVACAVGTDERPETERMVVGEVELTVRDPGGEVVLPMPVFECVGRKAPKKHYAEVAAPVFDEVWAAGPLPVLPPEWEGFGRIYRAAWEMFCQPWQAPAGVSSADVSQFRGLWRSLPLESGAPNGYVRTAEPLFLHSQFVWDSCFSVLGYAYGWRKFPVTASLD